MTLDEFRAKNPDYKDWDDARLADGLYNKFYSSMPREEFNKQVGYAPDKQGGYLSTFGHGMVKGLMGSATALGEATAAEMGQPEMQGTMPSAEQATDIMQREVTGPLPVMPGRTGKFVEAMGEAAGSPATYVGPGGLALKLGGGMLSAAGGEAGAQALESYGPRAATVGRFGGSLLTGLVTGTASMERQLKNLSSRLPTHADIKTLANTLYDRLRASKTQLSPEGAKELGQQIIKHLEETGHSRLNNEHAGVFAEVDKLMGIGASAERAERAVVQRGEAAMRRLSSDATSAEIASATRAQGATAGITTDVGEINQVRAVLTNTAGTSVSPSTREAAGRAVDAIDSFLMNVPERFVISGNPKADAAMLRQAQQLWSTHKQMETIEKATTAAQRRASSTGTASNRINAARQELRKVIDSEKKSRGMPQEVKDKIEQIVGGTFLSNRLRYASKFAPGGPVSAGFGLGAGAVTHDPFVGFGVWAAGMIAEHAGQYLTDRQIRQLADMMRGGVNVPGKATLREISPLMEVPRMTPAVQAARALTTGPLQTGSQP